MSNDMQTYGLSPNDLLTTYRSYFRKIEGARNQQTRERHENDLMNKIQIDLTKKIKKQEF